MGGGYGGRDDGVGSALFVINLQDNATPGKVEKVIEVRDNPSIDIINSIPGSPVVITADTSRGIKYTGALVYTNDFEGKITKYNLTNMEDDGSRNPIKLYDHTTLLSIDASTINGRYQYHSMDAGIGKTSKNMWLFSGTGDYERLTYRDTKLNNIMYGYRDTDFPLYKNRNDATADLLKLDRCSNTQINLVENQELKKIKAGSLSYRVAKKLLQNQPFQMVWFISQYLNHLSLLINVVWVLL